MIKKSKDNKSEPLCTTGRNVNWYSHHGKQYRGASKREPSYDLAIPLLGMYTKE